MRYILPLAAVAALAACSTTATVAPQLEVALTTAEQLALKYVTLPACPQPSGTLCSTPSGIAAVKASDDAAYAAVKGYESGTVSSADATAAVTALLSVIPSK